MSRNPNSKCSVCGKEFYARPYRKQQSNRLFCSNSCQGKGYKGAGNPSYNSKIVTCEECESKIVKKKSRIDSHQNNFCSQECKAAWQEEHLRGKGNPRYSKQETECDYCSKTIEVKPFRLKQYDKQFCNDKCHKQWMSKNYNKSDNPNWMGGYSSYAGSNWLTQREKAIERDGFQCKRCGMTRKRHKKRYKTDLHVDHVKPRRCFVDYQEANEIDNLNTLCASCHRKIESVRQKLEEQ